MKGHAYCTVGYCKIPKVSPRAYIFQRPFLRGLNSEGLIYGGKLRFKIGSAYGGRETCVSKSIGPVKS